ncbi:DRTGG domain-containing protein [Spirochaeta cellobiosiphila]|uniref:DRTGG domain-containing protein n=1 Tax=Spirochaeta cellobiosiphila TaxID=504483 RepID=UPI0004267FC2|nr:DRTGG domain-containing protein [Spirochaeta cellobiosiphila]
MKVTSVMTPLKANIAVDVDGYEDIEFEDIIACDLMSDVLVVDKEDFLLVTSLTSDQVARTSDIVGAVAIMLVNGKTPQPKLKELAKESGIPILTTPLGCFEACYALGQLQKGER